MRVSHIRPSVVFSLQDMWQDIGAWWICLLCEILDFAFVLLWKRCSEWVPPGGLGFGTGVEPRTVGVQPACAHLADRPVLITQTMRF